MSKIVILCGKNEEVLRNSNERIKQCFERITPENLNPKPSIIERHGNVVVGIFNPSEGACHVDDKCAYIGKLFTKNHINIQPNSDVPDGSFSLTRYNSEFLELVSDAGAMNTMWYILTPELFIASSSQRIIVSFLQSFECNYQAWQHFICRGALGIGQSWDKRINHIRSRERIILDRNKWELEVKRADLPDQRIKQKISDEELLTSFKDNITAVLDNIDIDWSKYRLQLSGGYDSRFLYMFFLKKYPDIKTFTWANAEMIKEPETDGYLAKKLTEYFKTNHKIYFMDNEQNNNSNYSMEVVLKKYLTTSEGRIDHIRAYMDGMKMYEMLTKDNIVGLIRGTQVFGTKNKVDVNRIGVLRPLAFLSPSDYPEYGNLGLLVEQLDKIWGKQEFPQELEQKGDENLFQWGERLWLDYTAHSLFGALNEIKSTYIDTIHPYMSTRIINNVWQLPDHLRADDKTGFRKIVQATSPTIPFAKAYGLLSVDQICHKHFSDILYEELNTSYSRNLLSHELINFIISGMSKNEDLSKLKDSYINPSFKRMAFRAYIIIKMNKTLNEDASFFA